MALKVRVAHIKDLEQDNKGIEGITFVGGIREGETPIYSEELDYNGKRIQTGKVNHIVFEVMRYDTKTPKIQRVKYLGESAVNYEQTLKTLNELNMNDKVVLKDLLLGFNAQANGTFAQVNETWVCTVVEKGSDVKPVTQQQSQSKPNN